jgi:predicted metal-dependent hydrolase
MTQKCIEIPDIGPVIISKRKGARYFRLSVTSKGRVRVSLPSWAPYAAGATFTLQRKEWLINELNNYQAQLLEDGALIGKSFRLVFSKTANSSTTTRVDKSRIVVYSSKSFDNAEVQRLAAGACERALKKEASNLLIQRLEFLASKYDYKYHHAVIKRLTGRWGSCSNHKVIALSSYLIQLPWNLIDYVIVHELIHTKHLHHGKNFWHEFQRLMPDAKARQKQIRTYRPILMPNSV